MNRPRDFEEVKGHFPDARQNGDGFEASCILPGHSTPTHHISLKDAGDKALITCHRGRHTYKDFCDAWGYDSLTYSNNGHQPDTGQFVSEGMFDYVDEQDQTLFKVERKKTYTTGKKQFLQYGPDGKGGWISGTGCMKGVRRVLFNLPKVLNAITERQPVFFVEGEIHVIALGKLGFVATTSPEGAGNFLAHDDYTQSLKGADLIILPDNDDSGIKHGQTVARSSHPVAARVRVLTLPGLPPKGDIIDWLNAGGTADQLRELAAACPTWTPAIHTMDVATPIEKAAPLMTISGAELLDRLADFYRRFVVMTCHQANTMSLWTIHTWDFDAADATPYINATSPEKKSGKTRLLEVADLVVYRPWFTARVTAAALCRKIDNEAPTLLLDESDAAFKGDREYAEALRGILNSGHRRGGKTTVCVGQGAKITYKDLSTFCPKAIAGIGKLPDTVNDRCIHIILKRKTASEPVERFRRKKVEPIAQVLRDSIAALVTTLQLTGAEPDLPLELDDRAQDGWEPLLAIADAVGGDWPQKARAAAINLSCSEVKDDQSLGTRLLSDIKVIFIDKQADRLSSVEIVQELNALEDAPWVDINHGKPLTPNKMASLLKPYVVRPKTMRIGLPLFKGYFKGDFTDVWNRYAPSLSGLSTVTGVTPDTNHDQKEKVTIQERNENVTDNKHEQLSYDVTDVTDVEPDGERETANDDVDLTDPPPEPPLMPEDDNEPDDLVDDPDNNLDWTQPISKVSNRDVPADGITQADVQRFYKHMGCPGDWAGDGTDNTDLIDLDERSPQELKDAGLKYFIENGGPEWHAGGK